MASRWQSDGDTSDNESEDPYARGACAPDEDHDGCPHLPTSLLSLEMRGPVQELSALSTRLELSREQQLRRLLSQRTLGQSQRLDSSLFATKRQYLNDEDAVLFSSFCNDAIFAAVCEKVSQEHTEASQTTSAVEEVLAQSNPLFVVRYTHPVVAPAPPSAHDCVSPQPRYAAAPDTLWWSQVTRTRETHRLASSVSSANADNHVTRGPKRARDDTRGASASAGLVAQSTKMWEGHLAAELSKDGETLESFRQGSNKSSYVDKTRFKALAALNEYQRELALQKRARDLADKRSIRRGEITE